MTDEVVFGAGKPYEKKVRLLSAEESRFADADSNPATAYELGRYDGERAVEVAVAAEREACAKVAERVMGLNHDADTYISVAVRAIRSRGGS